MAEITRQIGTTGETLVVRIITESTSLPAEGLTASSPGLSFWYYREGFSNVTFAPVTLPSLDSPYVEGGFIGIDDGYYRIDVPNGLFAEGATTAQLAGGGDDIVVLGLTVNLIEAASPFAPQQGGSNGVATLLPCSMLLQEAPASTIDGCPIRSKRRHVPVSQGVCGEVIWTMRDRNGQLVNLTACLDSDSISDNGSLSESTAAGDRTVAVRFQGCDRGCGVGESAAEVLDAQSGTIKFPLPEAICQVAGIYHFQVAVLDGTTPLFVDGGLISVEPSLWGEVDNQTGPPTIEELRFHLRDRVEENTLLGAYEFDDAEILEAIRWPIMQFNETPPPLAYFSCNNFPYRYHWRNAIVAKLLQTAAHSYLRNKLQVASGGLSVDDKNKNAEYMQMAMLYEKEWKDFLVQKKVELNANLAWGSTGW